MWLHGVNKMNAFSEELIAPCGMNCGICVAFFGYTMSGNKRKVHMSKLSGYNLRAYKKMLFM
jgi:hypothetical protein